MPQSTPRKPRLLFTAFRWDEWSVSKVNAVMKGVYVIGNITVTVTTKTYRTSEGWSCTLQMGKKTFQYEQFQ